MSGLSVRNLSIRFGGNEVIRDLDLEVAEGEFLVLLGPSGCGKSTLLHSIAGLIDVSGGTVEIGGTDMTDADPSERGIGMVFQSYALYPTMTVERNMSFGLRVAGVARDEIERRVQRVSRMLQLEPLLGRKPAQLSGGQRQRVAIGRALVREAGVFLFDEPLSNLDAKLRAELRREIKALHTTLKSTMIYVTHDQVEAMTLASRIAVMRGGVIQQIGNPGDVYDCPANLFVAEFLGAPGMNMIFGNLHVDQSLASFTFGSTTLDASGYAFRLPPANDSRCVLGVRPENVRLVSSGGLPARVTQVEAMGNHAVVWASVDELMVAAMIDRTDVKAGETVRLEFSTSHLSFFDQQTGDRL